MSRNNAFRRLYRFENELYRAEADFNLGDFKACKIACSKRGSKDNPVMKQAKWFSQVW